MGKKVKIEFKDWEYECADGCCTTYGTIISVNGKELEHPYSTKEDYISNESVGDSTELALLAVLKHLGYKVEIEYN